MTFTPIQKLIPKTARKYGIYGIITAVQICKAAEKQIEEIFKDRRHKSVKPKSYSKGELKILVPSSVWAQEITLCRKEIIDGANDKIGKKSIRSIKITTKSA